VGQKVNPIGFRTGVYRSWNSRWFARGSYAKQVLEDIKIRSYLEKELKEAEVSNIEIEKTGEDVRVIIHTARPGIIIGKRGQDIELLRKRLSSFLAKENVEVSVQEVKNPDLDAILVAKNIADQLVRRASFKKVMKKATSAALRAGAKGINICCSGRLGGAEIARSEWVRLGSVPRHTLRSDIDYGLAEALTTYGIIGVKVWICRGDYKIV
jgi:small subunit ribosomal protein S3